MHTPSPAYEQQHVASNHADNAGAYIEQANNLIQYADSSAEVAALRISQAQAEATLALYREQVATNKILVALGDVLQRKALR